jgi:hypothetical protein
VDMEPTSYFSEFSAPRLKTLSAVFSAPKSYIDTLQCSGIRFQALEELVFNSSFVGKRELVDHRDGFRMILEATINLKVLRFVDKDTLDLLMGPLVNSDVCRHHNFTLKYRDESVQFFRGRKSEDMVWTFFDDKNTESE